MDRVAHEQRVVGRRRSRRGAGAGARARRRRPRSRRRRSAASAAWRRARTPGRAGAPATGRGCGARARRRRGGVATGSSATSWPPRSSASRSASVSGVVADDHPQEAEQDVAVADRQAAAADHPQLVVARHVDEVARPLEPEPVEPRHHVRRRHARQDRGAAHGVGLVGLDAVRQQPPAPVLDRDRPPDVRLEVVDDLLQVRHASNPTMPADGRRGRRRGDQRARRRLRAAAPRGEGARAGGGGRRRGAVGRAGEDLPHRPRGPAAVRAGARGARALARVGARAGRGPTAGRGGPRGRGRRGRGAGGRASRGETGRQATAAGEAQRRAASRHRRGHARGRRAFESLSRRDIEARIPLLAADHPWDGGIWDPLAGSMRVRRTLHALAARLDVRRETVTDLDALEADAVLVCAGLGTADLFPALAMRTEPHVRVTYDAPRARRVRDLTRALRAPGRLDRPLRDRDAHARRRAGDVRRPDAAARRSSASRSSRPGSTRTATASSRAKTGRVTAFHGSNLMKFGPLLGDRLARSVLDGRVHADLSPRRSASRP